MSQGRQSCDFVPGRREAALYARDIESVDLPFALVSTETWCHGTGSRPIVADLFSNSQAVAEEVQLGTVRETQPWNRKKGVARTNDITSFRSLTW